MNENVNGFCKEYVPTVGDKLRMFFGYKFHHVYEPPNLDPKKYVGWMMTKVNFKFELKDRLRLLLTGKLSIEIAQHTTQQVDESINSVSFKIFAPFERDN